MGLEMLLLIAGVVLLIVGHATIGWILLGAALVIIVCELLLFAIVGSSAFALYRNFFRGNKRRRTV